MDAVEFLAWILDDFGEKKDCVSKFFDEKEPRAYIVIQDPDGEGVFPFIITIEPAKIEVAE